MIKEDIAIRKKSIKNIYSYYGGHMDRTLICFVCGIVTGVLLTIYSQIHSMSSLHLIATKDINIGETPRISSIFFNNLIVGTVLTLGIVWGRLLSYAVLIINGAMLGIVMCSYFYSNNSAMILISLLPHSAIEIPCLLMCGSIGMSKYKKYKMSQNVMFIGSIILGYMIAAVIEVEVSYRIAKLWM